MRKNCSTRVLRLGTLPASSGTHHPPSTRGVPEDVINKVTARGLPQDSTCLEIKTKAKHLQKRQQKELQLNPCLTPWHHKPRQPWREKVREAPRITGPSTPGHGAQTAIHYTYLRQYGWGAQHSQAEVRQEPPNLLLLDSDVLGD